MERYSMFLGRKNQYCENDYTIKCNLQIQCSVQFSNSVMSDSLWPHEPQHTSLPVHHQFLESTQIHVHLVSDAIQPSHPLSSPSPPALNLSQHQTLLKWVSSSHQVAKLLEFSASASVLPMNIQDWFPLEWIPIKLPFFTEVEQKFQSSHGNTKDPQ